MPPFRRVPASRKLPGMYDYSEADLEELGWDRFVTDVWQSIFLSYGRFTGIRTVGRRWSDLLQGGLGCTQEVADELVHAEIMLTEGRGPVRDKDPIAVLEAMDEVLADMGADLAEAEWIRPQERSRLLAEHARLRKFLHDSAFGPAES